MVQRTVGLIGANAVLLLFSSQLLSQGLNDVPVESVRPLGSAELYGRVVAAAVGPDMSLYLIEDGNREVRVISASCRVLHSIGRRGDGPGEFQRPTDIGWTNETLWIYDSSHSRLSLFAASGELEETVQFSYWLGTLRYQPQRLLEDGSIWSAPIVLADEVSGRRGRRVPILRLSPQRTILDTVAVVARVSEIVQLSLGGLKISMPHPVPHGTLVVGKNGEGAYLIDEREEAPIVEIRRIDLFGDTVVHGTVELARETSVSATLREEMRADRVRKVVDGFRENGGKGIPKSAVGRAMDNMEFPRKALSFDYGIVSRAGELWLRRTVLESNVAPTWYVFEPKKLELVSRLAIRNRGRIIGVAGRRIWAEEKGALGTRMLKCYDRR